MGTIEEAVAALRATGTVENVRIAERLMRLARELKLEGKLR